MPTDDITDSGSSDKQKATYRRYYHRNKEKRAAYYQKTKRENPEKLKETWKKSAKKNYEKRLMDSRRYRLENKEKRRTANILRKYGITPNEYKAMSDAQNGVCFICQKLDNQHPGILCVDHEHRTGKIRGLLCKDCNVGIAKFYESTNNLIRAIEYLTLHHAVEIEKPVSVATPYKPAVNSECVQGVLFK